MEINSNDHFATEVSRWYAVQTRNPEAATAFVYCIKTTGITCRPTCKARLARRSNVIFHNSYADARTAGFRACKRCRPEIEVYDPQKDVIARACKSIAEAEGVVRGVGVANDEKNRLRLEDLATNAGLTKSHFHRVFKKITGVTPRIYAVNLRAEKLLGMASPLSDGSTTELSSVGSSLSDGDFQSSSVNPKSFPGRGKLDGLVMNEFEALDPRTANNADLSGCVTWEIASSTSCQSIPTKDIEYTIQPWASGYVLIAATDIGICWLEAGQSMAELTQNLISEFPMANIILNTWLKESASYTVDYKHHMFATVMEALINPTGKTVDIPFDVQ